MSSTIERTETEPDERPGSAMDNQPRLNWVVALICVVVLPIIVAGVLWLMMDRSRGQPRPDMSGTLGPGELAPTGGELPTAPK